MKRTMILAGTLATLMSAATLAQAADEQLETQRLDEVLKHASAFGFTHLDEIEIQGNDSVELEGWLDEQWQADVRLALATGESLREERQRRDGGAWGMSEAEVRQAMELAVAEGLATFEEIQVDRDGRIDIEGRDAEGRELEVTSRQGEVLQVEHD